MAKQKQEDGYGQISRFYQTELLSSEECGVYLSNIEIFKISEALGFDITFSTNEFILAELFKVASESNRLNDLSHKLLELFDSRLKEYQRIKELYPNASEPVSYWIGNCQKTMDKIKKQMDDGE